MASLLLRRADKDATREEDASNNKKSGSSSSSSSSRREWAVTEVRVSSAAASSSSSCRSSGSNGSEEEGKRRIWRKIKEQYRLVEYHALPEYLRDNEFILSHYRADWPLRHTLLSIFSIHNETLNIWTHLIGFLLFLALTLLAVTEMRGDGVVELHKLQEGFRSLLTQHLSTLMSSSSSPSPAPPAAAATSAATRKNPTSFQSSLRSCSSSSNMSSSSSSGGGGSGGNAACNAASMIVNGSLMVMSGGGGGGGGVRWPFFVFLGGAMTCLLTSSTSHLLSCHSARMSAVMWRLDYAGIGVMIATSFFPPLYFLFQCAPAAQAAYLAGITLLGAAAVASTLAGAALSRRLRTTLFLALGLTGLLPAGHALALHWRHPLRGTVLAYEAAMVASYLAGTLVYAARVPERWRPGRFDIAGHSHQIFHLLVLAGALAHYRAALLFLRWHPLGC